MQNTRIQIHTPTAMHPATDTSCTPLCGCWILRATYLTAVMNKTAATWSCVRVRVRRSSADMLTFKWTPLADSIAASGPGWCECLSSQSCLHAYMITRGEKKLPDMQPAVAVQWLITVKRKLASPTWCHSSFTWLSVSDQMESTKVRFYLIYLHERCWLLPRW